MKATYDQRRSMIETIFPHDVPRLWCPLLTHYTDSGALDTRRITAHIRHMRPWISAFLAPGSTGDGWEIDAEQSRDLIDFLLQEAQRLDFSIMVGVLRTEPGTVVPAIVEFLQRVTDGSSDASALAARRVCGFTVTAPKGAQLKQDLIRTELETIARTGVPLAIYQLPQITENEMSPETVEALIAQFPNVYLLKDTSGQDRVALSKPKLDNLVMVRGAEGEYSRWIKSNGGYYDGFLLSTANSFAAELGRMIQLLVESKVGEAEKLSRRVSNVVTTLFAEAAKLPFGNAFANANKAFDHHFAWGPEADGQPAPMTHSGHRLPETLLKLARTLLDTEGFDTREGYMND
jgi:4-hydroxy-tetrahydrodipicolinate synthase